MSYHFSTTLLSSFDDAVARTREALAAEGFGVITEIDVQATLKKKLGVDFRPYLILGACNPNLAHEALKMEDKIGAMLPCNVVLQQRGKGEVEVSAIDPVASMQAVPNPTLLSVAQTVGDKLRRVIRSLQGAASDAGRPPEWVI